MADRTTKTTKIEGGYILLSRKLIESRIMAKPPLYLKVWVWLLLRAQHADFKDLKRGQVRTSIPEVQEAMSYYVGWRKETPTYKQIRRIFDWLRCPDERACEGQSKGTLGGSMVGIARGTHKMTVTLCNYCLYQNPKNYEGHGEGQPEGHDDAPTKDARTDLGGHTMNKNDTRMTRMIQEGEPPHTPPAKIKYAEFVKMTEAEHQKLVDRFGADFAQDCIEVLDNYKGANGKRYKSDYRAILNWVVKRVQEERSAHQQDQPKSWGGIKSWAKKAGVIGE